MNNSIAIIGMACRFPGAKNINEYWDNLCLGKETISFFTREELEKYGISPELLNLTEYVRAKGCVDRAEFFDAAFFGISPREAQTMDPQHRIFLECAWEALENSGYCSEDEAGRISIIAGVSGLSANSYYQLHLSTNDEIKKIVGAYQLNINNGSDFLSTRASYKFNFTGPSYTIQAGCSTSLIAISQACQNLLNYQCDMAVAGAVTLELPLKSGYLYQPGMILSPDGHCRAFDINAEGTVPGNGVGIIVLKRLEEAVSNRDHIYAVIKGFALNNDGAQKIGYTAPSSRGQAEVIAEAQAMAGVSAESITYIEAHGTGTKQGDPIEITGLTHAFRQTTQKKQFCAIGSVKTNIGHLDATSGVAGLIKTALSLYHQKIPPSLHFKNSNPENNLVDSPFFVNTQLTEWRPINDTPRRAGVSSFGIGGTNAHVVLEEAPKLVSFYNKLKQAWNIIPLSAKNRISLEKSSENLLDYLSVHPESRLMDIAYTYQLGRKHFDLRSVLISKDNDDTIAIIKNKDPDRFLLSLLPIEKPPQIIFMFPAESEHCRNVGLEFYENQEVFREKVDACAISLKEYIGFDIRTILYPGLFSVPPDSILPYALDSMEIIQPVWFTIEYALASLWASIGIDPHKVAGHGLGEYVAACIAGVFSLKDALKIVSLRGNLLQQRILNSKIFWPKLDNFLIEMKKTKLNSPKLPIISSITGKIMTENEAKDPSYWVRQIDATLGFSEALDYIVGSNSYCLLEVGCGQELSTFAKKYIKKEEHNRILYTLSESKDNDNCLQFTKALAMLWILGAEPDWKKYNHNIAGNRIPLPSYPFDQKRYWADAVEKDIEKINTNQSEKNINVFDENISIKRLSKEITKIWEKYLGVEHVNIQDNFFELGGDSLSANQAILTIQKSLAVDCPINAIFHYPTANDLANYLLTRQATTVSTSLEQVKESYPLSSAQQRMWFLEQYEAGIYNIPIAIKLIGNLNILALEESFNTLIARHPGLRTIFKMNSQSSLEQIILPKYKIDLKVKTISAENINLLLHNEAHILFNLAEGPLFKVKLFKLEEDKHILFMNQHHIITDGWSINLMLNELNNLYDSYLSGNLKNNFVYASKYTDFYNWQERLFATDNFKQQLNYWKNTLAGFTPLNLPTDYKRPLVEKHVGRSIIVDLGNDLLYSLRRLCKETQTTLFMMLLSALNVLLYKYSNQEDIVIGTPVANRNNHQFIDLVGLVTNTLVIRTDLGGDLKYSKLLERVREVCLKSYDNQDVPFEKLLEILNIDRDIGRNPIFQVMFMLENQNNNSGLKLKNIENENINNFYDVSQFDLTFHLCETKNNLSCRIEYNTNLFHADTIRKLAERLKNILQSIVLNPDKKINTFSIITESEKAFLISQLSLTETRTPIEKTLHALFEEQVAKTPDSVAIIYNEHSTTYAELNKKSNQLANAIRNKFLEVYSQSLTDNTLIGICTDRSLDMVVAILGILKSGAAYVPLDLSHPDYRMDSILKDAGVHLLISQHEILNNKNFLKQHSKITLCLEDVDNSEDKNIVGTNSADSLAYTIYTSGSTGAPKGVMVKHAGVVSLLQDIKNKLNVSSKDCLISITPISFDISVLEIFLPLISGARSHILSRQDTKDPIKLVSCIRKYPYSIVQATPSTWGMVTELLLKEDNSITVLVGGEQLPESIAAKLLSFAKKVWNVYGPTETTIWSTYHELRSSEDCTTIGRGFANTKLYVLDNNLNLVPPGIPGELYIAGIGLAQGYLNQHTLTMNAFIANPFATSGNDARLYKTGDIVRWKHNGELEYIGRRDTQVKVRGYRIELKEIEDVISKSQYIRQCVCSVNGSSHQKQIFAYYTINAANNFNFSESELQETLREYVTTKLPDYMIPAFFVKLDEFPVTVNGKIDYKNLPILDCNSLTTPPTISLAKSHHEHLVTELWLNILKTKNIDIDCNFFTLGANSLLIAQVHNNLTKLGYNIGIVDFFQYPTIRSLAKRLDTIKSEKDEKTIIFSQATANNQLFSIYEVRMNARNMAKIGVMLDDK